MSTDIQILVGKILPDEEFAKALSDNPEQALKDAGVEPTIDLLEALKGVDADSLQNLASAFGENQAAV